MKIHYLQHVPFEGLGYIAHWAQLNDHCVTQTMLHEDAPLPEMSAFDALIVMGGPMGVYDTAAHDWIAKEKHFIAQVLKQNKKVLGICLGAQLIADVLGAKVYPNPEKEIGWHAVTRCPALQNTPWAQTIPSQFFAFHWHGDTFDLPAGALHLAQNKACHHQAFFYPPAAIGLQFHLEATQESIAQLIQHCGQELIPTPYVQPAADIEAMVDLIAPSNQLMSNILDHFAHLP